VSSSELNTSELASLVHRLFPEYSQPEREDRDAPGSMMVRLTTIGGGKSVSKPWGEERWLVHESSRLVLKLIYLRERARTSLQVHRVKEEALIVLAGRARLVYADMIGTPAELPSADIQSPQPGNSASVDLNPGQIAHIPAGAIHRLEAVTALLLIETSTPELDDVVRLEDDWNRPDGLIEHEHERGSAMGDHH
jgi:mannose-6-phosphate isomerase-like protein (cupin superfamily)